MHLGRLRQTIATVYQRHRITLINTFIISHILAIVLGSSQVWPTPLKWFFKPYLNWTRLFQSWVLFGPEPGRHANKYRVDIEYKDGSRSSWQRPYPPNWNFFERHLAYNFQKHDLAARYLEHIESCRRDYVDYVLRLHWQEQNPPTRLTLVKAIAEWPTPTHDQPLIYDPKILNWADKIIEAYNVKDGKLQ